MTAKFTKYVCYECGSDEVLVDAWAEWNPATLQNELNNTFDDFYCESCEGECSTEEVEITDPDEIAFIRKQRIELRAKDNAVKMVNLLMEILAIYEQTDPNRPEDDDRPHLSGADVVEALGQYEDQIRTILEKIQTENLDKLVEPANG